MKFKPKEDKTVKITDSSQVGGKQHLIIKGEMT